ncbi:MAG: prepilin-type N-terminal cleavage/methylation domain-containing protein [Gemmatimonadales bacterium]|nr:MAG: prepilin-type N-terminal cleavage/methylation domain-containing protein [Gemmatimonadales bacterium]
MNKKGFTLIELLIVVVIIGILAAIAIPRFSQTRERAFVSSMQSDLRNLQTIQEQFYADPANEYTYAVPSALVTDALFATSSGVSVVAGDGNQSGWFATVEHAGMPDDENQCAIAIGEADNPLDATVASGVIVCGATEEA